MNLTDTVANLAQYEAFIFDNKTSFLKRFVYENADDVWDLIEITFSSEHFRFTFVTWDGQHATSSGKIDQLQGWLYDETT